MGEEEAKPCVNLAISKIEDSTSTMKTASIVKEDLNEGILKKKKVTGKTSDDRLKENSYWFRKKLRFWIRISSSWKTNWRSAGRAAPRHWGWCSLPWTSGSNRIL